ncbi:hypothetical protein JZ751_026575 [Albula glossodonta]|uniref:Uncharacterized protein n=1 Tax=Albula glossodonta TaxID=121402 RepID=A0A8T2PKL1_9TELE|nr:hypothetical protein JZ751_026575 [Albula glossodonta]
MPSSCQGPHPTPARPDQARVPTASKPSCHQHTHSHSQALWSAVLAGPVSTSPSHTDFLGWVMGEASVSERKATGWCSLCGWWQLDMQMSSCHWPGREQPAKFNGMTPLDSTLCIQELCEPHSAQRVVGSDGDQPHSHSIMRPASLTLYNETSLTQTKYSTCGQLVAEVWFEEPGWLAHGPVVCEVFPVNPQLRTKADAPCKETRMGIKKALQTMGRQRRVQSLLACGEQCEHLSHCTDTVSDERSSRLGMALPLPDL